MKNKVIERQLANFGIHYEYEKQYLIRKINTSMSDITQSRFINIDNELVETYRCILAENFPPIVIMRTNGNKSKHCDVTLDGKHRVTAYEKNGTTITEAYIINGDKLSEVEKVRLIYTLNLSNGKPHTKDEKEHHAVYLFRNSPNASLVDVANEFAISESRLRTLVTADDTKRRLETEKVNTNLLRPDVLAKLGSINSSRTLATVGKALNSMGGKKKITSSLVADVVQATKDITETEGNVEEALELTIPKHSTKRFPVSVIQVLNLATKLSKLLSKTDIKQVKRELGATNKAIIRKIC